MKGSAVVTKRWRDEADLALSGEFDFPEVKRLRENLLGGSDDEDELREGCGDLDSFMKSFQEEIKATAGEDAVESASCTGKSLPDLGHLFEASDADLGIPPPAVGLGSKARTELDQIEDQPSEFVGEFWEIPSYDSFGFGFAVVGNVDDDEYVAFDGLFDYSDPDFGSGDCAYRSEFLPAQ